MVAVGLNVLAQQSGLNPNGYPVVAYPPVIGIKGFSTHIESFCRNEIELAPLFDKHYSEVSVHRKRAIKLNPDWAKYQKLEQAGELLFVALRHKGKLVGYFSGFIGSDLHYQMLRLQLDLIFVHPNWRGNHDGQNGARMLMERVKSEAARRGVKLFTAGYKSFRSKHMKKLLEDGGFEPFEVHYALWI